MILYTALIIWILFIANLSGKGRTYSLLANNDRFSVSKKEALISFAPIIFFIGLRSAGADTWAYISTFHYLPKGISALAEIIKAHNTEFGFTLFGVFVKTFVSENYHVYLFLIALISGLFVVFTLRKYSDYFYESLVLFMLTGTFTWMINGIRQFIVISIAFSAIHYIIQKKPINYLLLVLLLTTVHASAIILAPVYFVIQGKAWNKRTLITLFASVLVIFATSRFTALLGSALEETSYAGATEQFASDDGASPIRTMINAVPVFLAFLNRKNISRVAKAPLNILINMSVLCLSVSCVAMVTSGILMGRLVAYFSIYNLILLPWLVHNVPSNKNLYALAMWMCYIFFYFYQCFYVNHYYYISDVLGLALN